ncbi:hypothetical protein D3C78_956450 [compost metagenome]
MVLLQHGLAIGHPLLVHQPRQIVPDRRDELRLGVEQVQHTQVGLQILCVALVAAGLHTLGASLRLQSRQAVGEVIRAGGMGRKQPHADEQGRKKAGEQHAPGPRCGRRNAFADGSSIMLLSVAGAAAVK